MDEEESILGQKENYEEPGSNNGLSQAHDEENLSGPFPPEILPLIFKYLPGSCRKKVRLTCKLWYNECSQNENMLIGLDGPNVAHEYLENCRLSNLKLHFRRVDVGSLPSTVWEKLGTRIHSLRFDHCKFGNDSVENIIFFCDNMRSLWFYFKQERLSEFNFSPEAVDRLNVTRIKLETLYFSTRGSLFSSSSDANADLEKWIRIFRGLYRIYPNVIHHGSYNESVSCWHPNIISCRFSKVPNETDQQTLAEIMAFYLVKDPHQGKKTIEALSKLRLKAILLCTVYSLQNEFVYFTLLLNLFTDQKELESIRLELEYYKMPLENNKALLLHIIDQCPKLQRLKYDVNKNELSEQLNLLSEDEWSLMSTKLKELSVQECVWRNSSSFALENHRFSSVDSLLNLRRVFPAENIQHLNVTYDSTSIIVLQYIFQYMTNLTSLKITLRSEITDFAITGWCEVQNSRTGFSIRRLQNLEQLTILYLIASSEKPKITDKVFDEFYFPKLKYINCMTPKKPSILLHMLENMPLLEEIKLTNSANISSKLLLDICNLMKKLRILDVGIFYIDDIEQIFKICPTLQFVHTFVGTYCYEPCTEKVVYKQMDTTTQILQKVRPYHYQSL